MTRDLGGVIAQWIAILAVGVTVVFRFAALEEAKDRAYERLADQEIRLDKQDDRIRAMENSRTLEQKISDLTAEVAALKVQVMGMRNERRR